MEKNKVLQNILGRTKDSAIILLIFAVTTILLSSILFFCNISITKYNILISAAITIVITFRIFDKKGIYKDILSMVIAIIIFSISITVCNKTYDLTWDGNTYHKLAIGMMKDGWNPVYQKAEDFIKEDIANVGIVDGDKNSIWIEHYPKASWIFAANIYSATNNIEGSKIINILMMYIGFCLITNYFYKKTNFLSSLIIAFLLIVNPISIVQTFNFYIDGLMGICLYIIIYALIALSDKNNTEHKKENALVLASALLICINLKFTGLIYSAIFCFMFLVLWLYRAYKESNLKQKLKEYLIYYIIVITLSIGIVGFSPYIKNIINKGNPLYPLIGKDKEDIMSYNQPKSFEEKNSIEKFFISIFGVGENIQSNKTDKKPTLKIPFTFTEQEIQQYSKNDLRISGFGPLFSGIFIISIILIAFILWRLYKLKKIEMIAMILAFIGIAVILVIITDGSWWARYVPYIYLFPVLALILLAIDRNKKLKIVMMGLALIMMLNIAFISKATYNYYYNRYKTIKKEIATIKEINEKYGKVKISLERDAFSSILYNLKDEKINVEIIQDSSNLKKIKYVNHYYYENY